MSKKGIYGEKGWGVGGGVRHCAHVVAYVANTASDANLMHAYVRTLSMGSTYSFSLSM